jgi:hypothetical protein
VISDQTANTASVFCLQPEKLSLSLSNAPTFDLSATDGTGITPVYLSVFWWSGMCGAGVKKLIWVAISLEYQLRRKDFFSLFSLKFTDSL